jgi:hypothetical protein
LRSFAAKKFSRHNRFYLQAPGSERRKCGLRRAKNLDCGRTSRRDQAKFFSRSHNAVIRVCDAAGDVIETHEHAGEFKQP